MDADKQAGFWAIIELFGHQRIAGKVTEQVIAGQGFVRVDVPEVAPQREGPIAAHTKLYGAGAIYAINFVDEPVAREAARQIRHAPISVYEMGDVFRSLGMTEKRRLLEMPEDA